jgi:hypothetical protein
MNVIMYFRIASSKSINRGRRAEHAGGMRPSTSTSRHAWLPIRPADERRQIVHAEECVGDDQPAKVARSAHSLSVAITMR